MIVEASCHMKWISNGFQDLCCMLPFIWQKPLELSRASLASGLCCLDSVTPHKSVHVAFLCESELKENKKTNLKQPILKYLA